MKKKYIYFQVGGDFTKNNLFNRIKKIKFDNKTNYIFHIDLTYTKLNELVKEFLFKFLIMKYYDYRSEIFSYNLDQIEIFIEIHNEIYNYIEKYPILKFCEIQNIVLSPLIEEEIINNNNKKKVKDSKIQIVSQIFKLLHSGKIGSTNIDLESTEFIRLNPIGECNFDSCQKLIDFYFNKNNIGNETVEIKNPNYYQKKMFINLLSDQFILFTESIILDPKDLATNLRSVSRRLGIYNAQEIREFIINSLIDNIKLYVKGPYENLIKEQKETDFYLGSEEEENRKVIDKLTKEKLKTMFTYDNIKQNIIAFQDGKSGMFFKIITSSCCTDEEFNKLNYLYNSQNWGKYILLNKTGEKGQKELLDDLLDLCGVENEIKKKRYEKK